VSDKKVIARVLLSRSSRSERVPFPWGYIGLLIPVQFQHLRKGQKKKVSNQIKSGIFLVVLGLWATNMTLVFILDPTAAGINSSVTTFSVDKENLAFSGQKRIADTPTKKSKSILKDGQYNSIQHIKKFRRCFFFKLWSKTSKNGPLCTGGVKFSKIHKMH